MWLYIRNQSIKKIYNKSPTKNEVKIVKTTCIEYDKISYFFLEKLYIDIQASMGPSLAKKFLLPFIPEATDYQQS